MVKKLLSAFNFSKYLNMAQTVDQRLVNIEQMINCANGPSSVLASGLLNSAKELAALQSKTDVNHSDAIHLILDGAVDLVTSREEVKDTINDKAMQYRS